MGRLSDLKISSHTDDLNNHFSINAFPNVDWIVSDGNSLNGRKFGLMGDMKSETTGLYDFFTHHVIFYQSQRAVKSRDGRRNDRLCFFSLPVRNVDNIGTGGNLSLFCDE